MSLYVSRRTTEIELRNKSSRIFYKTYLKKENYIMTPYHKFIINKPGVINVSNPIKRRFLKSGELISGGAFHARINKISTKQDIFYADFFELGEAVVVPIHVKYKDIIIYGLQDSVAITAYEIKEETWNGIFT